MTIIIGNQEIVLNFWTLAFVVSLLVNGFFAFYVRYLLQQLISLSETMIDVNNEFISFSSHLKALYEMETFYGDATLEGLINHTKHLVQKFEEFEDQVGFEDDLEELQEEDDGTSEENETPQIQQQAEVFYGGTRGGNS